MARLDLASRALTVRWSGAHAPIWVAWVCAFVALILSGVAYRVFGSHLKVVTRTPVALPVPLGKFPFEISNWIGKDVPLSESILRVAQNDDYLNRSYVNEQTKASVLLYVAYTARPRTMLGHRPQVCYPASGWVHDGTETSEIVTRSSLKIPCLVHRFHWPDDDRRERVVVNYYVVNGTITSDESVFSGVGWRTPNIHGDPAHYVAQVQIGSDLETSALTSAAEFSDRILDFLPDAKGDVGAAQQVGAIIGDLESAGSKP